MISFEIVTATPDYISRIAKRDYTKRDFANSMRLNHGYRILACLLWTPQALATFERPWLDTALPMEERLQLFLQQLNATQKFAMVQGDTELDDNGTGVNPCIGHISGNDTLGVPSICMGDGPAGMLPCLLHLFVKGTNVRRRRQLAEQRHNFSSSCRSRSIMEHFTRVCVWPSISARAHGQGS